jgi:hypothetical protein
MGAVAAEWVGARVDLASGQGTGGRATGRGASPPVGCAVASGLLVVLTDTAATQGCPGRPQSEELLLDSAISWMRARGSVFSCAATQLGFDVAGRPRLVLAVRGDDAGAGVDGHWASADDAIDVSMLPCTLVTFSDLTEGRRGIGEDDDVELLGAMRSWMAAAPDFTCEVVQMAHDENGRRQLILAGAGDAPRTLPVGL